MTVVAWLLVAQGLLGAFDTLYYHEWRARLPAGGAATRPELLLHAPRSIAYAVLFAGVAWIEVRGAWVAALALLLAMEIVITLRDFVVEDAVRARLGGVFAGERVTHAIMGITYGAVLAVLVPSMLAWWSEPTRVALAAAPIPAMVRAVLSLMAVGVLASGLRDLAAAVGVRGASWPWATSPWTTRA